MGQEVDGRCRPRCPSARPRRRWMAVQRGVEVFVIDRQVRGVAGSLARHAGYGRTCAGPAHRNGSPMRPDVLRQVPSAGSSPPSREVQHHPRAARSVVGPRLGPAPGDGLEDVLPHAESPCGADRAATGADMPDEGGAYRPPSRHGQGRARGARNRRPECPRCQTGDPVPGHWRSSLLCPPESSPRYVPVNPAAQPGVGVGADVRRPTGRRRGAPPSIRSSVTVRPRVMARTAMVLTSSTASVLPHRLPARTCRSRWPRTEHQDRDVDPQPAGHPGVAG